MFRPSLKSTHWLVALAVLALVLFIVAHKSTRTVKDPIKVEAAEKMRECMDALKSEALKLPVFELDTVNDPNQTGLIGISRDKSLITTSFGPIRNRRTTLNPNYAAILIDYLQQAGLDSLDYVAVAVTGANPGANLALYAAMETLKLRPIVITSVGAAEFGANREDFTWLDMERILFEKGLISFRSRAASMGGGYDRGGGLGRIGKSRIRDAILRNNLDPDEIRPAGNTPEEQIQMRYDIYQKYLPPRTRYQLYVNIGAGYGSIGDVENAKIVRNGYNDDGLHSDETGRALPMDEFKEPGVMMRMAETMPVIHVYDVGRIAREHGLPIDPVPAPELGEGTIFETKIINVTVVLICLVVLLIAIFLVVFFDRKDRHFTQNIIEQELDL